MAMRARSAACSLAILSDVQSVASHGRSRSPATTVSNGTVSPSAGSAAVIAGMKRGSAGILATEVHAALIVEGIDRSLEDDSLL